MSFTDFDLPDQFDGYGLDTVAYGNVFISSFTPVIGATAIFAPVGAVSYGVFMVTQVGFMKSIASFCGASVVANYPV